MPKAKAQVPVSKAQWQQMLIHWQEDTPQAKDLQSPLKSDPSQENRPLQRCERARQLFTMLLLVTLTLLGFLSLSSEGLPPTKPSRDLLREILSKAGRARIFQKS